MTTLTLIFLLPLLAAVALALVPRNLSIIMRGVGVSKSAVDKFQPKRLLIRSASALDLSAPRGHAERPLAGLFFLSHAC